jgi:hypothetical protein
MPTSRIVDLLSPLPTSPPPNKCFHVVVLRAKTICISKYLWNEQQKQYCSLLISSYSTLLPYEVRDLTCVHAIWLQRQLCTTWLCLIHHLAASELDTPKLSSFSIASATKSVEKWEKIHSRCRPIQHCCPVSSISSSSSGGSTFESQPEYWLFRLRQSVVSFSPYRNIRGYTLKLEKDCLFHVLSISLFRGYPNFDLTNYELLTRSLNKPSVYEFIENDGSESLPPSVSI